MANEAYIFDTGPIYCFIRVPTVGAGPFQAVGDLAGSISFLGTCERFPQRREEAQWKPVYNDLGGEVPFDESYQGEVAMAVLDLNRCAQPVLDLVRAAPHHRRGAFGANAPGTQNRLAVGSLLLQNGLAFELWCQHSHFGTLNAVPGLPPGRYYPACKYLGCFEEESSGTLPRKCRLVVEPKRAWLAATGEFVTFSEAAAFFRNRPTPS